RVVQDRRDRRLDVLEGLVAIVVETRPRREPDLEVPRIASLRAGARVDAGDRVRDDLGQETGPRDHSVPDATAEVQHAWTLGADGDGDPRRPGGRAPPPPLGPALVRRLARREEAADTLHVLLDPRARRRGVADVEDGAVAAGDVHERPSVRQPVD